MYLFMVRLTATIVLNAVEHGQLEIRGKKNGEKGR